MSTEKSLKKQNLFYITPYILLNCLIFWWFIRGFSPLENLDVGTSISEIAEKLISSAFTGTLIYLAVVIISGAINSKIKHVLIFWRLKNVLPGHRAFSELLFQDPRINEASLRQKHGTLPLRPLEQNRLWYSIYKKHSGEITVIEAHQNFLLMREITSITLILIIFFPVMGIWLINDWKLFSLYLIALCIITLTTTLAGRNYGERFVTNVLTVESNTG